MGMSDSGSTDSQDTYIELTISKGPQPSQNGYGLFTGGLGAHYGSQHSGAAVIPASSGNTERQIRLLKDLGTTIMCCTPSSF